MGAAPPVSNKVPPFSDVGRAAKELLYGDRDGVFLFEKQAKITTKTADGVEFGLTSKFKESKVEQEVTASYKADKYSIKASVNPAGKIITSLTLNNPVPNLTLGVSGALPDQSSGKRLKRAAGRAPVCTWKLTVDYAVPNLTLKSNVTLTQNPTVNLAATSGYKGGVFGVQGLYDSKTGNVSAWEAAAGYTTLDYQVAANYNSLDIAKLAFVHNINPTSTVGAEISKKVSDSPEAKPTAFQVGYAKRLQGGSLAKLRLNNEGIASLLYQAEVQPNTKVTHAVSFDATNLNSQPKYGFALDMKA